MEKSADDFEYLKERILAELDSMEKTASADAEEIYARIVSPDDDPDIWIYQLLLLNDKIREKINFYSLLEFVELCNRNDKSLRAWRQHAGRRTARNFVISEWKAHRNAYKGNKSEFTRHYVKRVFNEFGLNITEKQMREVWLKDTPVACNPDCLQATGQ